MSKSDSRANVAPNLGQESAASDDLDQQAALDRTKERHTTKRLIALEVGDPVVQISGGAAVRDWRLDCAAGSPCRDALCCRRSVDADRNAAVDRLPYSAQLQRDDFDAQRYEAIPL